MTEFPDYTPEPYWDLEITKEGLCWNGDQGPVPCELPLAEATQGMCGFARGWYFHPRRLRFLRHDEIVVDQGSRFKLSEVWSPRVQRR